MLAVFFALALSLADLFWSRHLSPVRRVLEAYRVPSVLIVLFNLVAWRTEYHRIVRSTGYIHNIPTGVGSAAISTLTAQSHKIA